MKTIRLIVSGRVQGVFFRDFTKRKALSLGIRGFVRNLPDGSVEAVAQGPELKVSQLVEFCRKGPDGAYVDNIETGDYKGKEEFDSFSIRY